MKGLRDITSLFQAEPMHNEPTITAGAGNDGSEVDGLTVDRLGGATTAGETRLSDRGQSAAVVVGYSATLASDETLTIAATLQDSPNGSAWTDIPDGADVSDVITDPTTGATYTGAMVFRFPDFHLRDRYVRGQFTATLSASGTDTCIYGAVLVVGNLQELP